MSGRKKFARSHLRILNGIGRKMGRWQRTQPESGALEYSTYGSSGLPPNPCTFEPDSI